MSNTKSNNLKIIPLGGQEEVGRNMTVFEYGKDIILLDMGIMFPEENMPGIDYVIPNTNYLNDKKQRIQAVVFTHGHLDHIGAAPILLKKLSYPLVIALPLTIAMIQARMEDQEKGSSQKLKTIKLKSLDQTMKFGKFNLGFFPVEHSIMDSMGITLKTDVGTVIHMGDWTLGTKGKDQMSYKQLAKMPKPRILMMESLGAVKTEPNTTEKEMWDNLERIITNAKGRIIIATFASQVERIKGVMKLAKKYKKKVALDGYSMKLNFKIARELGYLKQEKDILIDIKAIDKYPENKVMVIGTGAQGEKRAVMSRIITGDHRYIKLKKQDTVILSSSVIPGNEKAIEKLKDGLYRQCDNVMHNAITNVHVGGHNNIQAIQEAIKQIQPTYVLPVYARHFHLKEAQKVIKQTGFPGKNIFILDNGQTIKFDKNKPPTILKTKVDTSYVFIDGFGSQSLGEIVLRDREALAEDGIFVIIAVVDRQTGRVKGSPDIISRGFVHLKESKTLLAETRRKLTQIINTASSGKVVNWLYLKKDIRDKIGNFLYSKTKRRPMVLPVIIEV